MAQPYKLKTTWGQLAVLCIVIWLMFFIPFLGQIAAGQSMEHAFYSLQYVTPIYFLWIGIFCLNYFWLVPRYFLRKKYTKYLLLLILVYWLLNLASGQLAFFLYRPDHLVDNTAMWGIHDILPELFAMFHLVNLLFCILITVASISLRVTQLNKLLQEEKAEMEKERTEGELERLKGQLNPHFLFNTLNNISSLAAFDPDATQTSIARLSDMLRYVLYETSDARVPLQKDLDFIQNYIDLMNIRYEDTLHLDVNLKTAHPEYQIPPMLYISLLENAFKYGASSLHPCQIQALLEEKLNKDGKLESLTFTVKNTLLTEEEMRNKKKGGMGLQNLEKRLNLLYPGKHQLTCGETGDGSYVAKLELNTI